MKRKNDSGISLNLDSLLDTLTNVVGFLVILLALMQLGVGEAVKKIQETLTNLIESATPEAVAAAEQQLEENRKLLDERTQDAEKAKAQALADEEALAAAKNAQPLPAEQARATTLNLDELKKQLTEQETLAKEREQRLAAAQAELQKIKGQLETTPEAPGDPEAKVVNLPNPREAPAGAGVAYFISRGGRTMFVDVEGLRERSNKAIVGILKLKPQPNGALNEVDCEKLTALFDKSPIANKYFRVRATVGDGTPYMVLERKEKAGDTPEMLASGGTDTWRALRAALKEKRYARFLVWPDGFEAYLAARNVAEKVGIPSGWEPHTEPSDWVIGFTIPMRCKGAPPPAPPPPSPPATPAKPIPVDVVD